MAKADPPNDPPKVDPPPTDPPDADEDDYVTRGDLETFGEQLVDKVRELIPGAKPKDPPKTDPPADVTPTPTTQRESEADIQRRVADAVAHVNKEKERDDAIAALAARIPETQPKKVGRLARALWGGDE